MIALCLPVLNETVAPAASLDDTGTRFADGTEFSLRWVLLRLIAEYARHLGHADLLRERIDGSVGWGSLHAAPQHRVGLAAVVHDELGLGVLAAHVVGELARELVGRVRAE